MDLSPYVETLRRDLARAADAGGAEARALAERLTAALDPAARLALLDALSSAADEITRELAPGSVEVRLRSGEPEFVVALPAPDDEPAEPADAGGLPDGDEAATARINVRLSETLKARIEQAAARERLSVNAWLVRTAASAVDDPPGGRRRRGRSNGPGESYTGWVR
jgi:hypothetical protein